KKSSSGNQSFPAALKGTNTCSSSRMNHTLTKSAQSLLSFKVTLQLTLRSILAKPRALDARSLRLGGFENPYLISSEAVLSSALSQNSSPFFCRPASRNSPVDLSSIPDANQKSFPDWASPPRM
uniref:Uncharacterized protein n=1 Tax=Hippocampus comes TaxID=109280 RepID=A0A3Q2Z0T2_HIPCM